MTKIPHWKLDPNDVGRNHSGGTTNGRTSGRWSKQSAALNTRSTEIELVHKPTKISVQGLVKPGHYSNQQMKRAIKNEEDRLFFELQDKVAKELRIPGYLPTQSGKD